MTEQDVMKTQKIVQVRIHVERVIGQVKQWYHILQDTLPLAIACSAYQIWSVCCMLTNYRGAVIAEDHEEEPMLGHMAVAQGIH